MLGGAAEGKTWSGAGRGGSAPAATERRALFLSLSQREGFLLEILQMLFSSRKILGLGQVAGNIN